MGVMKNHLNQRNANRDKNPEHLQVTNIKFEGNEFSRMEVNSSRVLRHSRRREVPRMEQNANFTHSPVRDRKDRRPNTTGGHNRRQSEEYIEPW